MGIVNAAIPWSFRHWELTLDRALGEWEGEKLGRDRQ
jgi:hypothetical protein